MDLNQIEKFWDDICEEDPMWGILSIPQKRGNKWDKSEFFKSGKNEIDDLFSLSLSGIKIDKDIPSLDFGCGLGRCTRGLTSYFNKVTGVDLSASMIKKATILNKNIPNCTFVHNPKDNLQIFANEYFGFIYCHLTLQHIPPQLQLNYLNEFCRVLKRNGIMVFQIVSGFSLNPKGILRFLLGKKVSEFYNQKKYKLTIPIKMHLLKKKRVVTLLQSNNITVINQVKDNSAGKSFVSYKFICKKN